MPSCTVTKTKIQVQKVEWNEISLRPNGDRNLDVAARYLRTDEHRTKSTLRTEEFTPNTPNTTYLGPSYGPSKGGGGGASFGQSRKSNLKSTLSPFVKKGDSVFTFPGKGTEAGLKSDFLRKALKALGAKEDKATGTNESREDRESRKNKSKKERQQRELIKALSKSKTIVTKDGQELKLVSELMHRNPQIKPKKIVALNISPKSIPQNLSKSGLVSIALAANKGLPKELRGKQGPLANLTTNGKKFRAEYKNEQQRKGSKSDLAASMSEKEKRSLQEMAGIKLGITREERSASANRYMSKTSNSEKSSQPQAKEQQSPWAAESFTRTETRQDYRPLEVRNEVTLKDQEFNSSLRNLAANLSDLEANNYQLAL